MDLENLFVSFTDENIIRFFFKAFSIVFSLMYLLYAIVIYKQTQVMTKTIETRSNGIILSISLIQLLLGIVLLIFAIFFV